MKLAAEVLVTLALCLAILAPVPDPSLTSPDYRTLEATHLGVVQTQTGLLLSDGLSVQHEPSSWVFPYDIYIWGLAATSESQPGPLNAVILDADLADRPIWGVRWLGGDHYASAWIETPTKVDTGTHIGMMIQHGWNDPRGQPAPENVRATLYYTLTPH